MVRPTSRSALSCLPRLLSLLVASAGILLFASDALACPDCPTARVVRSSVFDEAFWSTLGLVILPLAVLGGIAVALYRIGLDGPNKDLDS